MDTYTWVWILIVVGIYLVISAVILLSVCMTSSRVNQAQAEYEKEGNHVPRPTGT